jgi:hypothetical protein
MGIEEINNEVERKELSIMNDFSRRLEKSMDVVLNKEYGKHEKSGDRYMDIDYYVTDITKGELNKGNDLSPDDSDELPDDDLLKLENSNNLVAKYFFTESDRVSDVYRNESSDNVNFAELYVFEGHGKLKCKIKDIKIKEIKIDDWQFRDMIIEILSKEFPLNYIEKESDQKNGLLVFDINHDKINKEKLEKERIVIMEEEKKLEENKKLDELKIEEEKRLAIEEKKEEIKEIKEIKEINTDNQNDNKSNEVDSMIIVRKSADKRKGNLFNRVIGWFKKK